MSVLLNVVRVTDDGSSDKIVKMILCALTNKDGLPFTSY